MLITYRSRFLVRGEVWFDSEPGTSARSVDWILYHQRSQPVPGARMRPFYTYLIELTQSREQLLAHLQKETAYKIRRARERDKITCECCEARDSTVMNRFEQMYNRFAATKGLTPLDRRRMESIAAAGRLDLSVAKDSQGNVLVFHANYCDSSRATELELPSLYRTFWDSTVRNLIGRANRYLTWSEIIRYKEQGLKCFDFGGWYYGTNPAMLGVNEFKRGFGGEIVREYQCEQVLTLKGWVVLTTAAVLNRAKRVAAKPQLRPGQREVKETPVGTTTAEPPMKHLSNLPTG